MTAGDLIAEAQDLEARAARKEKMAEAKWVLDPEPLLKDAAIFRSEAQAKRAKAERLRKK